MDTLSNQNLPIADIYWGVVQHGNQLSMSYDRTAREKIVKRVRDVFPSLIILDRMSLKASAILYNS